jgi:Zn-dependent protease with chaperone function
LEVYEKIKSYYPNARLANLYVVDRAEMNAYAVGRNKLGITRGLIQSVKPRVLQSIMAHEYGLASNDYLWNALYMASVNAVFWSLINASAMFVIIAIFVLIFTLFLTSGLLSGIARGIMNVYRLWVRMGLYIARFGSRSREFRSDEIAAVIGYREEAIEWFYLLDQINYKAPRGLLDQLNQTHPPTPERIANLEKY